MAISALNDMLCHVCRCQLSQGPSKSPSPTIKPKQIPSPSMGPSFEHKMYAFHITDKPSAPPSFHPSKESSVLPTLVPSIIPTILPSVSPSRNPSVIPSSSPTLFPSTIPSVYRSSSPTLFPTFKPTTFPSLTPTLQPSDSPSSKPTSVPSITPSLQPSDNPSLKPTSAPSITPSLQPSSHPSEIPSSLPSSRPSTTPTLQPSSYPSLTPSQIPTLKPSQVPSSHPSRRFDYDKFLAPDGAAGDRFGYSVGVSGSMIVVGAPFDDDVGTDSGSAHIFNNFGEHIAKLVPSDGSDNDVFGRSVAISETTILVGAEGDDEIVLDGGSVYMYNSTGAFIKKIISNDTAAGDHFGDVVAISNTAILITAPKDDDLGDRSGAAYMFDTSGNFLRKLIAFDGAAGHHYGWSADVSDSYIAIGAYYDDDMGARSGSAYLYDISGNFIAKLVAFDGAIDDQFGYSIGVSEDIVVVGSPFDDDLGSRCGSAYIFDTSGSLIKKIVAPDGAANENFGISVAVSESTIVIGAYLDSNGGVVTGSAYLFDTTGRFETKLLPLDGAHDDYFGFSVSISGNTIAIGAWLDDDNGDLSGSVYFDVGSG